MLREVVVRSVPCGTCGANCGSRQLKHVFSMHQIVNTPVERRACHFGVVYDVPSKGYKHGADLQWPFAIATEGSMSVRSVVSAAGLVSWLVKHRRRQDAFEACGRDFCGETRNPKGRDVDTR